MEGRGGGSGTKYFSSRIKNILQHGVDTQVSDPEHSACAVQHFIYGSVPILSFPAGEPCSSFLGESSTLLRLIYTHTRTRYERFAFTSLSVTCMHVVERHENCSVCCMITDDECTLCTARQA